MGRPALPLLTLVLALTISPAAFAQGDSTALNRLRSSDHTLADLIGRATERSTTFRMLVAAIQASNGIVYAEPGSCGHGVRACLKVWMQVSGSTRFLRIVIDTANRPNDLEIMRSLGHELQHVVEVLTDLTIKDGPTMFNYVKRMAPTDNNRFETTAAVNAGNAVYDELRGVQAQSGQVAAQSGIIQPAPIQAALDLLKWSPDHVPLIEVVEVCPSRVNPLAEGWTVYNGDGSARPTIYVAGWSALYRAVLANRPASVFDDIGVSCATGNPRE